MWTSPCLIYCFVFQCQKTNGMHYRERQPVCDLQAIEKEFKAGKYNSIVNNNDNSHDRFHLVYNDDLLWVLICLLSLLLLESLSCRCDVCDAQVTERGTTCAWGSETDQSGKDTIWKGAYLQCVLCAFVIVCHWFVLIYALSYVFDFASEFELQNVIWIWNKSIYQVYLNVCCFFPPIANWACFHLVSFSPPKEIELLFRRISQVNLVCFAFFFLFSLKKLHWNIVLCLRNGVI